MSWWLAFWVYVLCGVVVTVLLLRRAQLTLREFWATEGWWTVLWLTANVLLWPVWLLMVTT